MTNEEAIEILDAAGEGSTEKDWYKALDMGIAALENQERMQREIKSLDGIADTCDKLEKALGLAGDFIHSQDICPVENCKFCGPNDEGGDPECYGDGCSANLGEYFKRKVGLEAD